MSLFKNPFKKSANSDKQEADSPKFLSPSSRQPVDTQLDMGSPTVETGGSLFDGMDFGTDDVTIETSQGPTDITNSALLSDLKIEASPPPPPAPVPDPVLPVSNSPNLLKEEPEENIIPTSISSDLGSSQKKKTRKAKLPGGISSSGIRSSNSTPTPRETSPSEPISEMETECQDINSTQVDIRESVEKLLIILSELQKSRRAGEVAIESRVTELTARCQLQERRVQLIKLIGEAEEQEDFTTAERLNSESEIVERELREGDVRTNLLDVWNGFYSDVMVRYKQEAEKLEEMSGVRQDAADRLMQEARRDDQEYTRQIEEQRRELNLLVERQDHSNRQLGLDREHVQRQQQILEDDVTSRTSQLLQERAQLETRVEGLEEEIRELERKLSRLKSNREESLSDLKEVDERLGAVYESVGDERKRLEEESKRVELQQEELETQDKVISEKRVCFSNLEEEHKETIKGLKDKIERLKHAPLLAERIYSLEREPNGYQEELEAVLFTQLEEAQSSKLTVAVSNLSVDIDQLSVCRQECQEELISLEWNLSKGDEKLRQLDSIKKGLTQVKKYKEVRETAEERKKVSEKQEQLKLDIESKTEENTELSKQFEEKCSSLQAARIELAEAEQLSDTNILKCLQELTNNLTNDEGLEKWDPKRELSEYRLQVFELYKKELCIKHGWEYTSSVQSSKCVDFDKGDTITDGTAVETVEIRNVEEMNTSIAEIPEDNNELVDSKENAD
ncbi:hypothetical protein LOD99_2570 [Oopsacas minuta]|uniref:Uncharacterized protein n=1 Tax=Oopsacas minuta TaxID=111878 RepID=A0AAV7K1A7_9METZ|nr:hypothetical protein LOD99_2570 [Oopsacas minuta]